MLEFIIIVVGAILFFAGMAGVRRLFKAKTPKPADTDDIGDVSPTGTTMDVSFANEGPGHSLAHDSVQDNTVTYAESFGKDTVVVEVKRNKKESDDKPRKVAKMAAPSVPAIAKTPAAKVPKVLVEVRKKIVDRRNLLARFGVEEGNDTVLNNLYTLEEEIIDKLSRKQAKKPVVEGAASETKKPGGKKAATKKTTVKKVTVKKTAKKTTKKSTVKTAAKKSSKKAATKKA